MHLEHMRNYFGERLRYYVARSAIRAASFVLLLGRGLYRVKLVTFQDLRYALRIGETLRRLSVMMMTGPRALSRYANASRMPNPDDKADLDF
jgi:hypothetical protein